MARVSNKEKEAEKEIAKFSINYAANASVAERAKEHVSDMVIAAKNGRKSKEVDWLEDLRLWACQNSDAQMYAGRSNLIIPEMHNQVESSVGQFMTGLFPNDEYIGCIPSKNTNTEEAQDIKDAVFHELDHKNNLPSLMERFQRQKVLYGSAFLKPVFEKTMKSVVVKSDKGYPEVRQVPQYQGVKVHVMDTFHTYVWPETAQYPEEALVVFDESFIPKRLLEASKIYKNLSQVTEVQPEYQDFGWVDTVRLTMNNLSTATNQRKNAVVVTECWTDFDIVKGEFVPCVITLANYSTVIRVQRNPFWHQSKPYLQGRYIKGPANEAYGHSLPERLRSLQYMITDIGNQTMDSLTYSLNPIALIDPGFAGDVNSFKMQPGARWFASPQGVEFKTFPDISGVGFQGMQQVRQMIQQFSDLTPQVAPQLSGKPRSATQALAVQNEMSANLRNMTMADEFDVMSPLCAMTHMLLKQFQTEEYQIIIQGPEKGQWITKQVNPEVLQKDALFTWRGSEVSQKSAVRNQQLIAAFNLAMQVNQMMPGEIDLPELYKVVMNEAFDLKDLNVFTKDKEKKTIDPEIENLSLQGGEDCPVYPGDIFEQHMEVHGEGYKEAKTQESKLAYLKHMEKHEIQKKAKDMLAQQEAQIKALQQQIQSAEQPTAKPSMAKEGNPNMVGPVSPDAIMSGIRAVEPNVGGM